MSTPRTRLGLATGVSLFVLAPAAMALDIRGTEDADRIIGSRGDDRIAALAGDDKVLALPGNDKVRAGDGNDKVSGSGGDDLISAGTGDDRVRAGDGQDTVKARGGADVISGGDGRDLLTASAGADVAVEGVDTLVGGSENDELRARDGEADVIDCGRDTDTAVLDLVDVIVDATEENLNGSCEIVVRADVPPDEPPTPTP